MDACKVRAKSNAYKLPSLAAGVTLKETRVDTLESLNQWPMWENLNNIDGSAVLGIIMELHF